MHSCEARNDVLSTRTHCTNPVRDTAICSWAAEHGDHVSEQPRYVVETGLRYHAPCKHPENVTVRFGLRKLGNSSVEYQVAMFDSSEVLLAEGKFVHVYIGMGEKPVRIPDSVRSWMNDIVV